MFAIPSVWLLLYSFHTVTNTKKAQQLNVNSEECPSFYITSLGPFQSHSISFNGKSIDQENPAISKERT